MEELSQTELARVVAGFPRELGSQLGAWHVADLGRSLSDSAIEPVHVCGEEVRIPYGVDFGAPFWDDSREPLETAMIHCVYTRHHDGYVREARRGGIALPVPLGRSLLSAAPGRAGGGDHGTNRVGNDGRLGK